MEKKWKISIIVFILVVILAVLAWGIFGRAMMNHVLNFTYNDEFVYDSDHYYFLRIDKTHDDINININIEKTEDAKAVFELLKNELKYESMDVERISPSQGLAPQYDHFYLYYNLTYDVGQAISYQFLISSQENTSHIKCKIGDVTIQIYVSHDDDIIDCLKEIYEKHVTDDVVEIIE